MATQNPIEQEGTYPLPEAQVDRFMLMVQGRLPDARGRAEDHGSHDAARAAARPSRASRRTELLEARKIIEQVYVDDKVKDYIVDVVFATREPAKHGLKDLAPLIEFGASPRASHRAQPRRARARVPAPPRLRHARGREGHRPGRAPPSRSCSRTRPTPKRSRPSRSSAASSRSSRFPRRAEPPESALDPHDPEGAPRGAPRRSRSTRRGSPTSSSRARTSRASRARGSRSARCARTSRATTSARSTGTCRRA